MTIPISPIGAPIVVGFLILFAICCGYVVFKNLEQEDRQARKKQKKQPYKE